MYHFQATFLHDVGYTRYCSIIIRSESLRIRSEYVTII